MIQISELFNEILRYKRMSNEGRKSILVSKLKNKVNIQSTLNYRCMKLMSYIITIRKKVIESIVKTKTGIAEN